MAVVEEILVGLAGQGVAGAEITVDLDVLRDAFEKVYLAGRAQGANEDETLLFLRRTCKRMLRSVRRAMPTPREGIEAGLELMLAALDQRLD